LSAGIADIMVQLVQVRLLIQLSFALDQSVSRETQTQIKVVNTEHKSSHKDLLMIGVPTSESQPIFGATLSVSPLQCLHEPITQAT
jgi:hypothetical protein